MAKKEKSGSFEEQLGRLEEIVAGLESEATPLEDSLALFEEGVKISKDLSVRLEEVKRKIEVLRKNAAGEIKLEELDGEKDS